MAKYDWPALLEAQARSGLTQAAFCRQHGVDAKYFSLQKSRRAKASQADRSGPFVQALPKGLPAAQLTLSLPQCSLRFGSDTDPAYVAKLVALLS